MKVKVNYTPRGKTGMALCSPLNFIGDCICKSIDMGYYNISDGSHIYKVSIQDMEELEDAN